MTPVEPSPIDPSLLQALLAAEEAGETAGLPQEYRDCFAILRDSWPGPDATLDEPWQLGRFQVLREVGRGGFGIVYQAHDPVVARDVAIKVPNPEVLVSPVLRQRFLREARAA